MPGMIDQADAKTILARLVSFDTTSRNSNLDLIAYVVDYLKALGIEPVLVPNETGDKASLFATIGPTDRGGVALSGHTDVVPARAEDWTTSPYRLTARDDRLYGRGACDMKGFLAAVLAAVPAFKAADLSIPIHLVFSYDEEVGCAGVLPTIAKLGRDLPRPALCIVGEPTLMSIVDAHKSIFGYVATVTGRSAHSSKPQLGANSIIAAAALVGELDRIGEELRLQGDPSGRFDPGWTSLGIGLIEGGIGANIVPPSCRFWWELRGLPGFLPTAALGRLHAFADAHVLPRLHAGAPEAAFTLEPRSTVPPLAPDTGSPAETLALKLARRNETFAVSYGTEAGNFQRAGIPTVVCGPGSIDQAHTVDEWLEESQLVEAQGFLSRLLEHCRT